MSSPYTIARSVLDQAQADAAGADIDAERLFKALVSETLQRWTAASDAAAVRSAVEFELQHMGGDEDVPFMRP